MNGLLFDEPDAGARASKVAALDDLFSATRMYRSSERYRELLTFIGRFRKYAPFNCFLLHMQKPTVSYVATPQHWLHEFNRTIKEGAHPLVILAPMAPVLFVFDADDTEGDPLPKGLVDPFFTDGELGFGVWEQTVSNLARDRILLVEKEMDRANAGTISEAEESDWVVDDGVRTKALYRLTINSVLDSGGKYATLAHELGHLYSGHRGTPDEQWWPWRKGLTLEEREFEAESICSLVCARAGVKNDSAAYLADYLNDHNEVPEISLDRVLKAAGLIENMGKRQLPPHKKGTKQVASM